MKFSEVVMKMSRNRIYDGKYMDDFAFQFSIFTDRNNTDVRKWRNEFHVNLALF